MRIEEDTVEAVLQDAAASAYQEGIDQARMWFYREANMPDITRTLVHDVLKSPPLVYPALLVQVGLRFKFVVLKHGPFLFLNTYEEGEFKRGFGKTAIDATVDFGAQFFVDKLLGLSISKVLIVVEGGRLLHIVLENHRSAHESNLQRSLEEANRFFDARLFEEGYLAGESAMTGDILYRAFEKVTYPLHWVSQCISQTKEKVFDFVFEGRTPIPAVASTSPPTSSVKFIPSPASPLSRNAIPTPPSPAQNLVSGGGIHLKLDERTGKLSYFAYAKTSDPILGGLALLAFAITETPLVGNIKTSLRAKYLAYGADENTRAQIQFELDLLKLQSASEGEFSVWNAREIWKGSEKHLKEKQRMVQQDLLQSRNSHSDDPPSQFTLEAFAFAATQMSPEDFLPAIRTSDQESKFDELMKPYRQFRKKSEAKIEASGYGKPATKKILDRWQQLFPHDVTLHLHQATQAGANFQAVESALKNAKRLARGEQKAEVNRFQMKLYYSQKLANSHDPKWECELEKLCQQNVKDPALWRDAENLLVSLYHLKGDISSAIKHQEALCGGICQSSDIYNLACLYTQNQQPADARASLDRYFNHLRPKNREMTEDEREAVIKGHFLQASIAMQSKDKAASISALGMILKLDDKSLPAWHQLGEVYLQSEPLKALACFRRCLSLAPTNIEATLGKATAHYYIGAYRDAVETCESLTSIDERSLFIKGLCFLKMNRKQQARQCLQAAEALNPATETCKQLKNALEKTLTRECVHSLMRVGFRAAVTVHQSYLTQQLQADVRAYSEFVRNAPFYLPTSRYATMKVESEIGEESQISQPLRMNFF